VLPSPSAAEILMARNCHKSAYHGVILNHLKTAYIYPQIIEPLGIQGGISAEDVEKLLEQYQDTEAVLVVSPTYDGVVSDIRGIAGAVHKRGLPLIVDEAHGAQFFFWKFFLVETGWARKMAAEMGYFRSRLLTAGRIW